MSYCRWSECDVYAYDSCEGGVRFWVAGNDNLNRLCKTYNEAYQYAKKLRDKHGLDVPLHAIDALREDAIDEAKQYFGPDSAVADMLDENAKLKEERDHWRVEQVHAYGNWEDAHKRATELEAENAKLRELVRELLPCYQWSDCYDGCMAADGPLCPNPAKLTERARELGVEVDG